MFVNPLTALAFVETLRAEGHKALVHTAAASNLGQMLNRICIADGVPLVNVVRSEAQAAILRDIGAIHRRQQRRGFPRKADRRDRRNRRDARLRRDRRRQAREHDPPRNGSRGQPQRDRI
jgi:hypothetical protein